jgi:hypothetical protein
MIIKTLPIARWTYLRWGFSLIAIVMILTGLAAHEVSAIREKSHQFYQRLLERNASVVEVVEAHRGWSRISFSECGHVDNVKGRPEFWIGNAFLQAATFGEFFSELQRRYGQDFAACGEVTIDFNEFLPYRGTIDFNVDESGKVLSAEPPRFQD